MSVLRAALVWLLALCALFGAQPAQAQSEYDASWYNASQPYVQIDVAADGVYRVDASSLRDALPNGTSLSGIDPTTLRLFGKGSEAPLHLSGTGDGELDPGDTITFVGQRNRGTDELWAYDGDASAQSSTYYSLYSDTTTYWLTWGGDNGLRYQTQSTGSASSTSTLRDTVHVEEDNRYYFGRPSENGNARYTESEGYFWDRFSHNSTGSISNTYTVPVDRRADDGSEQLNLSVRLDAASNACHYVEVEARLRSGYESVATVEWDGFSWNGKPRPTVTASIAQDRIPDGGLELRLTSYNSNSQFTLDNCNPSGTPNYVLLDWIEARYTRTLAAENDRQRFVTETSAERTYELSGHSDGTVYVYNPRDAHRFEAPVSDGETAFTTVPNTAPTAYWAAGPNGFRPPAAVRADASSNWSATTNEADYLILTTEALRPSAQRLADYRRTEPGGGYQVEVALVQNVFDEFDYGRPTPLAIRRFVRATQDWAVAPRFLSIFADAQYPIDDGSVETLYPEWSVPSFGYSPSDGWFAMQAGGPDDWSEILAIGRIPVRSVAQGDLFIEKLKTYERGSLQQWPKRMLLLAGGTSSFEQNQLQSYSDDWGEIAADTFATTTSYKGPAYTGMDTLQYYKNVTDALDASFQDSLSTDLKRGAGWLSYFGHSAAQTWEIVTDPPSEFGNAGKLPVVVSLGCRTGSFAGGRFEEKSAPSLGEQLVVGSVKPDGTPRDGALNGGIAHFGESALGNRRPSARINDALIQRVFLDTTRVLGEAIRSAKDSVEAKYGGSDFYVKHLLQYGLLGDPATQLALPAKPDLHVDPSLISVTPVAPTPSEPMTVSVTVQSRGLIPSDSVSVQFTWEQPDGNTTRRTRRVERFPLQQTLRFSFSPTEQALGTNTFRVRLDPSNEYAEVNESNNTAQKEQVVFNNGIELLAPADQGLVSELRPSLQFVFPRRDTSTTTIALELDTIPSFDSPALQRDTVQTTSLSDAWTPPQALSDGTTYYWRSRVQSGSNDQWTRSQFTVLANGADRGWLQQDRLFQNNQNERIGWTEQEGWTLAPFSRDILVTSERGSGGFKGVISVDGSQRYENRTLGFGVVVMDGISGRVKKNESFCTYEVSDNTLNERRCGGGVDGTQATNRLESFLQSVDTGDYVFIRTRHLARSGSADISDRVETLLRTLGGSAVDHSTAMANDSLSYNDLWLMLAKKGAPNRTIEKVASASTSTNEIIQRSTLSFTRARGTATTARIGPTSAWSSLQWQGTGTMDDSLSIDVLAADTNRVLRRSTGLQGTLSLDDIDATAHPYLRLRATLTDSTTRTAPQLQRWSVSYKGVPELVVDPIGLRALTDSLQQGQAGLAQLPVVNLGAIPSDSVYVRSSVTNASNVPTSIPSKALRPLAPGERDTSTVEFSTANLSGRNTFTGTAETKTGPPERRSGNNTVVKSFFVRADRTPPSVRVLASGREIPSTPSEGVGFQDANLPFVSTTPSFEIVLEDDNTNLSLDDTSHVDVYLKGGLPQRGPTLGDTFQRISFGDQSLQLISPDSSAANVLRVLFEPDLQQSPDSTYTLKVEAEDAKGNSIAPYQGSFRIQQNQVIRDAYPYPNPMSSHTTFAFRVQGGADTMLRDFALRIYTLSGRLVREFTDADLETPLGVGWNTLRWNGQDEDGDPVATGVYLYRVRVEGDDQTFRGDVEKVTVIR